MSGAISIWPQLPGFSRDVAAPAPPPVAAPQGPTIDSGARAKMADALYEDVYAKTLPREEYDKKTAAMSDVQIADAAYKTFYDGKISRRDFNDKLGLKSEGSSADAIMRGGMMGFADEATAGLMTGVRTLGSLLSGDVRRGPTLSSLVTGQKAPSFTDRIGAAYDQELQAERDKRAVYNQNSPIAGPALELAGGLLTGAAGAGANAAAAPTRMATALNAGKVGAVSGFGEAEGGITNRVEGAGTGAAAGVAIGAAAPYVVQGAGMLLGKVGKMFGLGDSEKVASQLLLKAFKDDGIPPDQIAARVQAWQQAGAKPETLFDLGGENVKRLARTAAGRTGPGTEKAVTFLEGRQADQAGRVAADVEAKLGQSATDFHPTLQALDTSRRVLAAPKYEAAFSRIVPTADEAARVQHFITSKNGQDGLQRGLRVLEEESVKTGAPFNPKAYGVVKNDAGLWEVAPDTVPNLRLMDAVKRGYDRILDDFRDKATGRLDLNDYTRAVEGNRAAYVAELRNMFPRYAGALDAWAGPSTMMDAANRGRKIFSMKDSEIVAMAVEARAKPGEADAFRLGVAQAVRDQIASAPHGADAIKRIFGSPKKEEALREAFPSPQAFAEFKALMEREAKMYKNAQFVSPRTGSQTQLRDADAGDFGSMATDAAGALLMGAAIPGRTTRGAVGQIATDLAARGRGISPGVGDALAGRLFNSDPQAMTRVGGLLSQLDVDNALAKIQSRRLGGLLLPGLIGGANVAR